MKVKTIISLVMGLPLGAATTYVDFNTATSGSAAGVNVRVSGSSTQAYTNNDDTFGVVNDQIGTADLGARVFTFGDAALPLDSVNISGSSGGLIEFSQPVLNPVLHFYQLDANELTFLLNSGQSMALVSSNNGQLDGTTDASGTANRVSVQLRNTAPNTYQLNGANLDPSDQLSDGRTPDASLIGELEGAGTIQFFGTFSSIRFNSNGAVSNDQTTRWAVGYDLIPEASTTLLLMSSSALLFRRRRLQEGQVLS